MNQSQQIKPIVPPSGIAKIKRKDTFKTKRSAKEAAKIIHSRKGKNYEHFVK